MDRIRFKSKKGLCFQTPHDVCARIALCVRSPRGDAGKRLRKFVERGSELKSESRRVWVKGREVRVVFEGKGLGVSEREESHGSWLRYEAGTNDKAGVVGGAVNPFPLA